MASAEGLLKQAAHKGDLGERIRAMARSLSLETDRAKSIGQGEALEAEAALLEAAARRVATSN